jgi:hypothetical protein
MKSASSVCIGRYTFSMRALSWLIFLAAIAVGIYAVRMIRQRIERQRKASEERAASLLAQVAPPPSRPTLAPAPTAAPERRADPQERMLFDAACKAAEGGEPALSIQLYARLLARYPQTGFAAQARSAVEGLKKKL